MGMKESVSSAQVHFSDELRGVDGDKQLESNSRAVCSIVAPGMNKFQVWRDLRENHLCLDCELSLRIQEASTSVVPKSPLKVVTPTHFSSQKKSKELTVYTRRKNRERFSVGAEIGIFTPFQRFQGGRYLMLMNLRQSIVLMAGLALLAPARLF